MSEIKKIVVLTGAGISAESGLKTFRDAGGLWENHRVEEVATYEAFSSNPELVYRFYNLRREQLLSDEVTCNTAHKALAEFEEKFDGEFLLVTQNVDNLHEQAGSKNILHMHGELLKMRCEKTEKVFDIFGNLDADTVCECCGEKGNLRPHIVWFGEMPMSMDKIGNALKECDLFISIGTSGLVYPAAMFVDMARYGAKKVELNLEGTPNSHKFDEHRAGKASEIVPAYLKENFKECLM